MDAWMNISAAAILCVLALLGRLVHQLVGGVLDDDVAVR